MGLFTDGDGIPLAFSLFPGNQNEQKSLKPLETKILQQFGCDKFIYCSDAGLASEDNRVLNHMGQRSFIVTQSIKKLPAEDRAWALNKTGFKRLADDKPVDPTKLTDDDKNQLYYKDEPFTTKKLDQRLIITYSPKYAAYQKAIRAEQICRAEKMVANSSLKGTYTTEQLLHTLRNIKFADVEEQGFMPVYERQEITDDLHETCGFRTDYQFITKRKMKEIQKKSKRR